MNDQEITMTSTAAMRQVIPMPQSPGASKLRAVPRVVAACSACHVLSFCLPNCGTGMGPQVDALVAQRPRVKKGGALVFAGAPFTALFTIRSGSCKLVFMTPGGQEQVAGYHIIGDVVGAEGIYAGRHECTITALEDSEFCAMPFDRVAALARESSDFQHSLNALLSREIGRERKVMLMLGTMRAEQRLASFLLDLSDRYRARGYSSSELVLRMTREEIGCHLSLKLETVSRLFSRFHKDGLLRVQGREVKLLDRVALQQLADATLQ
jgi:CRP/FNR family transcriptional regulator